MYNDIYVLALFSYLKKLKSSWWQHNKPTKGLAVNAVIVPKQL